MATVDKCKWGMREDRKLWGHEYEHRRQTGPSSQAAVSYSTDDSVKARVSLVQPTLFKGHVGFLKDISSSTKIKTGYLGPKFCVTLPF